MGLINHKQPVVLNGFSGQFTHSCRFVKIRGLYCFLAFSPPARGCTKRVGRQVLASARIPDSLRDRRMSGRPE